MIVSSEHLNESSQARNWSWEPGAKRQKEEGRRKKEEGRRKEPEEVFLQLSEAPSK
ncbi:hypothetical protein [Microcoleus vaginatus]|uniref:hypothetical protein n=1 Tax=Microcoleus vaginatus TaxID=119532 RepID=UPI0002F788D6